LRVGVNALQMKSAAGHSKAGLSRYAWCLIEALIQEASEHQFDVYVNQQFVVPKSWEATEKFRFIRTRGKVGRMPHVWGTLTASLLSRKYDVWLSLAHTLPMWSRTRKVLVIHDLFALTNPELYVNRRARITAKSLARSIAIADRLIAVSESTRQEVHRVFGTPLTKIDVTLLGPGNEIQRRERATVREEELQGLGVPWKRYLLMLSTIEPRKNVPALLKAFASLIQAPAFQDLGLAIAGGRGWETSEVFQLPGRLGIESRVRFLGYVDDQALPALFAACEAFVLPSLTEGFGITVLEAMLAGAPVVCSRTGSLPEVGGDAALYFDPTDVEDISRVLAKRLAWAEPRDFVIGKGLMQAQKFDWRNTARGTLVALAEAHRS
jgi:glycosyltransferase involved in cell wall biosynthesis